MYRQRFTLALFSLLFWIFPVPAPAGDGLPTENSGKAAGFAIISVRLGNLRSGPATGSAIIGKLKRGDTVHILGRKDRWFAVRPGRGGKGWAHSLLFSSTGKGRAGSSQGPAIRGVWIEAPVPQQARVIFQLNGRFPPRVFTLDQGRPRVVCDFPDAHLAKGVPRRITGFGGLVRQVRIAVHKRPRHRLRVVLDLESDEKSTLEIQPLYIKDTRRFAVILKDVTGR